jgi:hypothetical protein
MWWPKALCKWHTYCVLFVCCESSFGSHQRSKQINTTSHWQWRCKRRAQPKSVIWRAVCKLELYLNCVVLFSDPIGWSVVYRTVDAFSSLTHEFARSRGSQNRTSLRSPAQANLTAYGGWCSRLGQRHCRKPAPGGTLSGTTRLELLWDRQATQGALNHRSDEEGSKRDWKSKIIVCGW